MPVRLAALKAAQEVLATADETSAHLVMLKAIIEDYQSEAGK
ncbi:hypothetical protein OAG85_00895 [Verrucomicrobiales bacterium]|nr:hypothetical protein [Verrucomicrobiales bacterium]MDB4808468.1 hypothetical protein [Verrucomicrobiales bacterium]